MVKRIIKKILSYPPTHEYNLKGLKPKGILKIRLALMKAVASNFFIGNKQIEYLDTIEKNGKLYQVFNVLRVID